MKKNTIIIASIVACMLSIGMIGCQNTAKNKSQKNPAVNGPSTTQLPDVLKYPKPYFARAVAYIKGSPDGIWKIQSDVATYKFVLSTDTPAVGTWIVVGITPKGGSKQKDITLQIFEDRSNLSNEDSTSIALCKKGIDLFLRQM